MSIRYYFTKTILLNLEGIYFLHNKNQLEGLTYLVKTEQMIVFKLNSFFLLRVGSSLFKQQFLIINIKKPHIPFYMRLFEILWRLPESNR
jgi:hypothetical protein